MDLYVYNASQTLLGRSISETDSEQVTVNVVAGQYYYVRVIGYNGATNPNYSLTIDQPEGSGGGGSGGDPFEQNDSFEAARALPTSDQVYGNLSIDAPNDDDFYSLVPATSGTLTVSLTFLNSQGDVDLQVSDFSRSLLGSSNTTGNSEQVSVPVLAGQTYYIRVFGYNGAVNSNYTMTIDVPEAGGGSAATYYLSTTGGGTLSSTNGAPPVSFANADILQLTVQPNGLYGYQLHFDGSDVGLSASSENIDAFALLTDGSILISTLGAFSVPASGGGTITGNGEDLLRFVATSLGATTAGQWSLYFDGSDAGLSGSAENIDGVARLADGRLLLSTAGAFSVSGVTGEDEDLLVFTPTSLGPTTAGSWALYFDGSDVGLAMSSSEDINALYIRETGGNPTLYVSTTGSFSVTGLSGNNEDVFTFNPSSLGTTTSGTFGPGLAFDGSLYGLSAYNVDGIHLGPPPSLQLAPASLQTTLRSGDPLRSASQQEEPSAPSTRSAAVTTRQENPFLASAMESISTTRRRRLWTIGG